MDELMPSPGFADPVHDAQQVFRTVLEALSRPTLAQDIPVTPTPPEPLDAGAAALVLTLCDGQTPIWIDSALAADPEVANWIRFHTGAPIVDVPALASFAIASAPETAPALADLDPGTDEAPHASTTLIVSAGVNDTTAGPFTATGPGVNGSVEWDGRGLPVTSLGEWRANTALFPRGIDIIIAGPGWVRGLPRTTALDTVSDPAEAAPAALDTAFESLNGTAYEEVG